jgi:hypothetical protein
MGVLWRIRLAASCEPPVVLTYTRSVKTGPFFSREFSEIYPASACRLAEPGQGAHCRTDGVYATNAGESAGEHKKSHSGRRDRVGRATVRHQGLVVVLLFASGGGP